MENLSFDIFRSGDSGSLREARNLFEKTEQLARLGYWEWDEIEDRCVFCSLGLAEIAGITPEEYLARASSFEGDVSWAHPDDRQRYRETVSQAIAKGEGFQIEYRFLRPDGRVVDVYEEAEPVFAAAGGLVATRGFVQDISRRKAVERDLQEARHDLEEKVRSRTSELQQVNEALKREIAERHRVEADLRAHQAQLKRVHRMAKIGVFIWDDVALEPIHYSDELAEMFGMTVEELLEKRATCSQITESIDARDREAYNTAVEQAEAARIPYTVEYRTRQREGGVRYWRELGEPILGDDGRLLRTLIAIQDITDIRRAEEALRQAQKMEAIGQLTGGVAHDFNNLLAIIQGNAELLDEPGQDRDRLIAGIQRAAENGAKLTQRLLAFSRRQPLSPRQVDLAEVVGSLCELLQRTLGAGIEIETVLPRGLRRAMADRAQVENAILNLAINARDAMPQGGKLVIRCTNASIEAVDRSQSTEMLPGDYVVLEVGDTGSGMAPDVMERAFEPFFTTKDVGQGSGLGLSMVYGFAKQSGGNVTIESAPGLGTAVRLFLPGSADDCAVSRGGATDVTREGRNRMVLVVEDNADLRDLTVAMLLSLGYRAAAVANAREAQAALVDGVPIDLLLSDVILPGGTSGPELAVEARRRQPGLKVVLVSGYPANEIELHGLPKMDVPLLKKPFRKLQLAKALRQSFER